MHQLIKSIALVPLLFVCISLQAQSQDDKKYELAFLVGTIQPFLLDGGNVEVDFYTPKLVFNYSHGFSLDITGENNTTVGDIEDQGLAIHFPYSTGFGVGYRLYKYVDVRLESKFHRFEVYYDGTDRTVVENQVVEYTTATLGVGTYFRWKPFEKKANILKGIFTSTSIRFWPKIYSSLDDGEISYFNVVTDQQEIHETANIGIANTPLIFNISIGYSIVF